ncbi:MAG: glycosyltransferase [Bacteroidota bacterium]|nr:glycosyltransferase [Bacteroidota bacterium]
MNNCAPIVLFVYNRPNHTEKTINALSNNYLASESDLFIFSDAAKNAVSEDDVKLVRDYIKTVKGFKSVTVIEREVNFGLIKSISEGVTDIVTKYKKIIVLEDDLITHKQFLEYMNKSLELYENNDNVCEITGYSHLNNHGNPNEFQNPSYFLKITSTWGWATWTNRWEIFSNGLEGSEDLNSNKRLKADFNYNKSYNYYKMLNDTKTGKAKSWGIVWYWNIFKNNGLTLYPVETLVDQIGFDGTGENSKNYVAKYNRLLPKRYEFVFPTLIEENSKYRNQIIRILRTRKLFIILKVIGHVFRFKRT